MRNGTICDKHKQIIKLAEAIVDLADKAFTDGNNMEDGLCVKRARISDLESQVAELKKDNEALLARVESLQDELKFAYAGGLPNG